ncbi:DNA-binding protein [Clostridium sp. CX1]|uniref:DNA-binding protein n=1 Tax=Clostridium tanneri TaxID=3037988 RepID=A0ABU4JXP1_9CLOT|nr:MULTISPECIES: CLJU_RS11820 family redox protein [unclassified Clostridium]MCT8978535.1 DNA-binding protein [Clostridium sp. CX1]MDW8802686.1 DNA-binding protein [Clostridium sp. A1-XYC3]
MNTKSEEQVPWICFNCGINLQLRKTNVTYLGGNFEVELMKCPKCGMVLITEELAAGKMLEVEKGLEDK